MRYFLDQDQSSHWHIVEEDHHKEWSDWCALDEDDPYAWETPSYAKPIGSSPCMISFENPTSA